MHEGFQTNVGEALNRIIVVPLGRGPEGFYSDISERDVLDVMADVEANYPVDLERVFSGGYSMGGYGTLRMATTYPDRFAGYIDWVGYPGDACGQPDIMQCQTGEVGIPAEWLRNLREVDGAMLYSGADELVNSAQGLWLRGLMAAVGYPHIFYYHPGADHFTYALADDWMKEAAYTQNLVRRTQPPRVTYRTAPYGDSPELGIRHDRAYWVSEIVSSFSDPRRARLRRRRHQDLRLRRLGADVRRGSAGRGRRPGAVGVAELLGERVDADRAAEQDRGHARERVVVRGGRDDRGRLHPTRRPARLPRRDQRTDDDHDLGLSRAELRRGRHLRRHRAARARVARRARRPGSRCSRVSRRLQRRARA